MTPGYDGNGSLTAFGTAAYEYDKEGWLIQVSDGMRTIQYEYDALGSRIASIENGVRTELLVDPAGISWLFGEYTINGGNTVYAHGNGVAARIDDGSAQYYHYDLVGSTHLITDVTATVSDSYSYLPFGELISRTGSTQNPFTFNGQFGITDSGVADTYYMRNRSYSATLGRFLELDSIDILSGETNLYRFGANNPITNIDPTGLLLEGLATLTVAGAGELSLVFAADSALGQSIAAAEWQAFIAADNASRTTSTLTQSTRANMPLTEYRQLQNGRHTSQTGKLIRPRLSTNPVNGLSGARATGAVAVAATAGWYIGREIDNVTDWLLPDAKESFCDSLARLPIGRGLDDKDSPIYDKGGVNESNFNEFVRKNMQDPLINSVAKRLIENGEDPGEAVIRARRLVRNYRNQKITKKTEIVRPSDPNNIVGPAGAGPSWVPTQDLGVGTFRIWVRGRYNDNTYTQFIRNQNILGTSFTPTTPLPAGNYVFWVRATGPGGFLGRYSTRRALNIGGKPSVTSPVGVITDTTPVIAWTPVDGAVRYDLWINRVDTPQAQIVRQTSLTTAEFETSVLPQGTYRVWVRAFTSDDTTGDWSNPWSFSIHSTAATAPSLLSPPAATFNTQPTFTWTALPGANHYLLHVRNLSNSQMVIQAVNITATSFTPVTEMDAGSYRVWVRAYAGNDVLGEFSDPRDFGINTAPVLSVSTSALPGRPSFTWTPVELADRYELLVNRLDIAINGVIHETNLTGVEYTPVEPLAAGTIRSSTATSKTVLASITANPGCKTMSIEYLVSTQRIMETPHGVALGCSYRWPGGQYCAIHTDRGIIGCGLYDISIATRFSMAIAIARGTPEHPLFEPEDLLSAQIVDVSESAEQMGIRIGMTGNEALQHMLAPVEN